MNVNPIRGFVPERVASSLDTSGRLTKGTARTLASEYATCSGCGKTLDGEIYGGREVDRDVEFNDVECSNCDAYLQILVEEKVWGFVSTPHDQLAVGDVFELDDRCLFINPKCIFVSMD